MNLELRIVEAFSGLTVKEIAEKLVVPERTLRNWIKGERDIPTVRLAQIAELTNVSLNWLLTGVGEKYVKKEESLGANVIKGDFNVQGDGTITVSGDAIGRGGKKIVTKKYTEVKKNTPPPGSITEKQAAYLKEMLDDLGEKLTRRDGATGFGNAHGAFKRKFGLTSYKNLQADRIEEAIYYLKKRIKAVEGNLQKAGLVVQDRSKLIDGIHNFCRRELKWNELHRKQSMMERYQKASLTEMTLYELEDFLRYVTEKARREKAKASRASEE